jgi:hypothetical protein
MVEAVFSDSLSPNVASNRRGLNWNDISFTINLQDYERVREVPNRLKFYFR